MHFNEGDDKSFNIYHSNRCVVSVKNETRVGFFTEYLYSVEERSALRGPRRQNYFA